MRECALPSLPLRGSMCSTTQWTPQPWSPPRTGALSSWHPPRRTLIFRGFNKLHGTSTSSCHRARYGTFVPWRPLTPSLATSRRTPSTTSKRGYDASFGEKTSAPSGRGHTRTAPRTTPTARLGIRHQTTQVPVLARRVWKISQAMLHIQLQSMLFVVSMHLCISLISQAQLYTHKRSRFLKANIFVMLFIQVVSLLILLSSISQAMLYVHMFFILMQVLSVTTSCRCTS